MTLSAGIYLINAEVASTETAREIGLSNRSTLDENQGLLLVFPEAHRHCIWMQGTSIPLSVAFLDDNGDIVSIQDMMPNTKTKHCAKSPVHFALEMKMAWFTKKGIKPGFRISRIDSKSSLYVD